MFHEAPGGSREVTGSEQVRMPGRAGKGGSQGAKGTGVLVTDCGAAPGVPQHAYPSGAELRTWVWVPVRGNHTA